MKKWKNLETGNVHNSYLPQRLHFALERRLFLEKFLAFLLQVLPLLLYALPVFLYLLTLCF